MVVKCALFTQEDLHYKCLKTKYGEKCLGLIGLNCCGVLYDGFYLVARPKTWDCGLSLAGFVGSNAIGGIDICLSLVLCVVR